MALSELLLDIHLSGLMVGIPRDLTAAGHAPAVGMQCGDSSRPANAIYMSRRGMRVSAFDGRRA